MRDATGERPYNGRVERITSRQNPLVGRFRNLARTGGHEGRVLLVGSHLVGEALGSGVPLEAVAVTDAFAAVESTLVERASRAGARIVSVPPHVLAAMSPVQHPSGIVAIGRAGPRPLADLFGGGRDLLMLLYGVQDPGNVGAIVRSAEACGASGLVAGAGTADPFGWKALRGSMGSAFRLPIAAGDVPAAIGAARSRGVHVLATVPRGGTPLQQCDLRQSIAVVLGGEGPGLTDDVLSLAAARLSIPMRPPVESINVSVAAGLVLYEAWRQREASPAGSA